MISDEQEGFRAGRGCVDQIFSLKQIGEKARKKNCSVYVGSIYLERHTIGLIGKLCGKF